MKFIRTERRSAAALSESNGMLMVKTTSYWAKTILFTAITTSSSVPIILLSEIISI